MIDITFDKESYKRLEDFMKNFPGVAAKIMRKAWTKTGMEIVKDIRAQQLSGSGPHSLGRGPGFYYKSGKQIKRKHLKQALSRKVKFRGESVGTKWQKAHSFGGYLAIKPMSKVRSESPAFIGRFHEFGTRYHPARSWLQTGWQRNERRIFDATDQAIDGALK